MTEHLKRTPLYALHKALDAKMTPFAGYEMPVQYAPGVLKEHLHTRQKAGLFDVSHMGQAAIVGPDHETAAKALETLVPGEMQKLGVGRQRYTVLLNDEGGVLDDLMVSRPQTDGRLNLVVNAACKETDYAHMEARLPSGVRLERFDDRALLALQGPAAAEILSAHAPEAAALKFMTVADMTIGGVPAVVSRSGYTGEDGYEISVAATDAEALAKLLLDHPDAAPIGLGARDSLRLEAGLCLYGHDIDETTNPVEADLAFTIGKARREAGDFPGAAKILRLLREGTTRKRVGIRLRGRGIAREGAEIATPDGTMIGTLTSGGFGASVDDGAGAAIGMGYVPADLSTPGTELALIIRGKPVVAEVAALPFYQKSYKR